MQHLMQQIKHLTHGLFGIIFSYFFLKYSNITFIIVIIAIINAPKAIDPK